ncbi:hypothetical protein NDU88_003601 [Pleurodeles waltl]|uniref:Uncharacterized protein n=1 Tax=Pleurodeles waltl TaxID=8319 RepID=A0AAV7V2W2_PLEWA|nr:hypothetical protein NDU88_003601 [Pleurodeles waltl]
MNGVPRGCTVTAQAPVPSTPRFPELRSAPATGGAVIHRTRALSPCASSCSQPRPTMTDSDARAPPADKPAAQRALLPHTPGGSARLRARTRRV